jgi:hypothetical protein
MASVRVFLRRSFCFFDKALDRRPKKRSAQSRAHARRNLDLLCARLVFKSPSAASRRIGLRSGWSWINGDERIHAPWASCCAKCLAIGSVHFFKGGRMSGPFVPTTIKPTAKVHPISLFHPDCKSSVLPLNKNARIAGREPEFSRNFDRNGQLGLECD